MRSSNMEATKRKCKAPFRKLPFCKVDCFASFRQTLVHSENATRWKPEVVSFAIQGKSPGGGGGDSHMKQTGMLVVSLRGVNFGFWSRLGCSGKTANILSCQGLI